LQLSEKKKPLAVSLILIIAGLFLTRLPPRLFFIDGHSLFIILYYFGGALFLAGGLLLAVMTLVSGNILEL
jgi:hypothetical protein